MAAHQSPRGIVGADPPRDALHGREGRRASGGDLPAAASPLAVHQRTAAVRDPRSQVAYGVHVYGSRARRRTSCRRPRCTTRTPSIARSMHDGSGPEPGLKDARRQLGSAPAPRAGSSRSTERRCATWHDVLGDADVPARADADGLHRQSVGCAACSTSSSTAPRIGELGLAVLPRLARERSTATKGYFEIEWGVPQSWDDVILQGPTLSRRRRRSTSRPTRRCCTTRTGPRSTSRHLRADAIPVTSYKPRGDRRQLRRATTPTGGPMDGRHCRARPLPRRLAHDGGEHRRADADSGDHSARRGARPRRLLASALPSDALRTRRWLRRSLSSLVADFCVRAAPKSRYPLGDDRTPRRLRPTSPRRRRSCFARLRLNCLTDAYADSVARRASSRRCNPTTGLAAFDYAGRRRSATSALSGRRHATSTRRRPPPGARRDRRPRRADARADRRRAVHDLPHPVPGALRLRPQHVLLRRQRSPGARTRCSRVWRKKGDDASPRRSGPPPTRPATPTSTSCRSGRSTARPTCGRRTRSSRSAR